MTLDIKRLIAVMGMTGSAGDGEALNAVRLANKMLRAAGKNWNDVLTPGQLNVSVGRTPDYRTPPSKRRTGASYGSKVRREKYDPNRGKNVGQDIQEMLTVLSDRKHDMGTMMFLASLNDWWERNSFLTDNQYASLKRLHDRGSF